MVLNHYLCINSIDSIFSGTENILSMLIVKNSSLGITSRPCNILKVRIMYASSVKAIGIRHMFEGWNSLVARCRTFSEAQISFRW